MATRKALTLAVMLALLAFAQATQAERYLGAGLAVGLAGLGAGIGYPQLWKSQSAQCGI